jgi:hypothetical protein
LFLTTDASTGWLKLVRSNGPQHTADLPLTIPTIRRYHGVKFEVPKTKDFEKLCRHCSPLELHRTFYLLGRWVFGFLLSSFRIVFGLHLCLTAPIGDFTFILRRWVDNLLDALFALVVGLDGCLLRLVDGYRSTFFCLVVTLFRAALRFYSSGLRRLFDGMAGISSSILSRGAGIVDILSRCLS